MSVANVLKLISDHAVEFVDLRFVDMLGTQHHVTFPAQSVDEAFFEDGKMFDGSSIAGWKGISESDMVLMPDPATAILDPFMADPTLILTCDVLEPHTMQAYTRDPRSIARRAEAFLKSTGIADTAFFGPEPEFFIFDAVHWQNDMGRASFEIESDEAAWSSNKRFEGGNSGHRPGVKGGYFPVPPVDSLQDIRSEMCKTLERIGQVVEVHHHEVGTAGQCEIGMRFNTLVRKADELIAMKYVIRNVAHQYGKTACFTPAPACMCISRWPRAAPIFLPVISMAASRRPRCGTSAASSSTRVHSTRLPTPRPTATSAWYRASRRRSCSPTRHATVRPVAVFHS